MTQSTRQKRDIQVRQSATLFPQTTTMNPSANLTAPFMAKVKATYSDRMACDLETFDGQSLPNVPVMSKAGLSGGEHYGELDLPVVDDVVIVIHASYGSRHKVIIGTVFPYLANEFKSDAVGSGSKQFTKRVLVADKPLEYRRIFPSGFSVQIGESGGIVVETPSGTYFIMNESTGETILEDSHGNKILMSSAGVTITDSNGNSVTMEIGKVVVNGNLEVLQ